MDTIRKVDYFSMEVPHKPGVAAQVLNTLKEEGIDLLAFTGFPSGRRAQLDFIPVDSSAFTRAAKRAKLAINPRKTGFLSQGPDRVGVVADLVSRLADAGINVTAIDAVCAGEGRYGAIFWVKPPDVAKAARILGAS